ncbi:hypothetical protein TNCV_2327701 [Trichonephila clavipes]|nr:hypothetical protein TNCV_2327701 [Trichonephila clavipes]
MTRPARSAAMPEWMSSTYSNSPDSMNTRLVTLLVSTGRLGDKRSGSQSNRGVYGEEATGRQHVAKWCHSFQSGRQVVENCNMGATGQVLQRQSSPLSLDFAPNDYFLFPRLKEHLFGRVLFRQCCENIHRDLAQWPGA